MAWPTLSAREQSRKDEAFSICMLTHSRSLSFSLLAISQVHTFTNTEYSRKLSRAQTHTVRMPADTIKHKHICMYVPVLKKTQFCHFLQITLPTHCTSQYDGFFYLLYSQIKHMTLKPQNNLYGIFKLPRLYAEVNFWMHLCLISVLSRATGTLKDYRSRFTSHFNILKSIFISHVISTPVCVAC